MLIELIATFALGVGAAGTAMLLRRIVGDAIPRYAVPFAAGLAMIGFTLWSEYSWYSRTVSALPPKVVVTQSHAESSSYRPWTYLKPFVSRFAAVDQASIRRNDRLPGHVLINILLFTRHGPTASLPLLIDCVGNRRADIVDGVTFDADGAATGADWYPIPPEDPLIGAACRET